MNTTKTTTLSPWAACSAVLAAQFSANAGAALAKTLFPMVGTSGVASLRIGLAALVLLAVVRPWRVRLDALQWRNVLIYGVMLAGMNLCLYQAFQRLPLGVASAIEISGPLAVSMLASRRGFDILWLALAIGSLSLLLPSEAGGAVLDRVGILFGFGAASCWALYIVFGNRVKDAASSAVTWGMLVAGIIALPMGLAQSGALLLQPSVLLAGLCIALLSSVVPNSLDMVALRNAPPKVFGLLSSAQPAVAALIGLGVLGERLGMAQWVAIAGIVLACAGSVVTSSNEQAAHA
ncbi:EamA family transporter [Pseudomonas sp. dw_358]|uniref:EamA family transporter n=1 Tax=Pseudomonas sp. dw_358 TaxID=2720083 RepID=UPI001BD651B1|nr:EamA family transporter [Pseudomonas sp. dw_358]